MAYTYYTVAKSSEPNTPKDYWRKTTQKLTERQLKNASSYLQIEKFNPSTGLYTFKDARVVKISTAKPSGQSSTATNNTDDYREIIFGSQNETVVTGDRYRFENRIWLTMASDTVNQSTLSCVVRRCNNYLRWYDKDGNFQKEPIVILDKLDDSGNSYDRSIVLANAAVTIVAQATENVKSIIINQRFIFGSQAFKVESIKDFTQDGLITIDLFKDQISATDDLANGIAEGLKYVYTVDIVQQSFQQSVGYTGTLTAEVKLNGNVVTHPIAWSSSNPLIGTISSSGVVTLLALGSVVFTASINENVTITDTITIDVVASPTVAKQVVINPQITKVLQGREQVYTVYKITNGVQDTDAFTITASGASNSDFMLTILDSNTFKVSNINRSTIPLLVNCISDVDSMSESISIELGGLW